MPPEATASLLEHCVAVPRLPNDKSAQLAHTRILDPGADERLLTLVEIVAPRLAELGELLFGERLEWSIKEMWLNVLEAGGFQAPRNQANSFVSGVLYLTQCHPQASLVFVEALGHPAFVFKNTHPGSCTGPQLGQVCHARPRGGRPRPVSELFARPRSGSRSD